MKKHDLFMEAMRAEEYRRRAWVISAFAVTSEAPDAWRQNSYAFRIVQTPVGVFYVDPSKENELTQIEDAVSGQALFSMKEKVLLKAGDVPNLKKDVETTYGQLLFNFTVLVYAFGKKIEYVESRVSGNYLEDLILPRFCDDPDNPPDRKDSEIYVSEYRRFTDAMFFIAAFTQLCVPGATPKSMVAAPGIVEYRKQLIEENKDRLRDPAVIAEIDAKLVAYDTAYLKGDLSEGFLITKKSRTIVRKKMFAMHGAEVGLREGVEVALIENSLSEGWDISKFPEMNNSLRAGSFNRGYQTMKGGEAVKWLLRSSSNIAVTTDDCGSTLGLPRELTDENHKRFIGFHVISEGASKPIVSEEDARSYIGKHVIIRSPMMCILDKTDYCKVCVGPRLAANPSALAAAVSAYGSAFMSIYLAAAHGKALQLEHMDFSTAIT